VTARNHSLKGPRKSVLRKPARQLL
jgi:hypothetical protein